MPVVDAALGDGNAMDRAVELAVAAAVQPKAVVSPGARRDRGDAGVAGKARIACKALGTRGLGDELGGAERPAAGQLEQGRCLGGDELAELALELLAAARDLAQAVTCSRQMRAR